MDAQYFAIQSKHPQPPGFHPNLANFSLSGGEAVSADIVCTHPSMSLYCLDDAAKQAIFVELPPEVDLAKAPFVYLTQYEQSLRLVAVPYHIFQRLASSLPPVKHLVMIYMTGRSGSTLLNHLFNELDTVLSLSEPDAPNHFVHLRGAYDGRDAELRELLDSTVRFSFKPTAFKTPSIFALKLRNEGTQLMSLYQAAFPQARNLFLYRDAIGFVRSFYRIFKRAQFPESMPLSEFMAQWGQDSEYDYTTLASYLDPGTTDISSPQLLTLWWLGVMEWYIAQYQQGLPVLAVRYSDLNANREQVVARIFKHCGLPTERAQEVLSVFARDAQAGTILARDNPQEGNTLQLSDEQRDGVIRILQRHPIVQDNDFVVPGTLQV